MPFSSAGPSAEPSLKQNEPFSVEFNNLDTPEEKKKGVGLRKKMSEGTLDCHFFKMSKTDTVT